MSITIFVLDKCIPLIKNRYPKISVSLFDKLRRDRLWSPAFLFPPFRWRVGRGGYFSTSKLVILFIHLY